MTDISNSVNGKQKIDIPNMNKQYIDPDKALKRLSYRKSVNKIVQVFFSLILVFIIAILGLLLYDIVSSAIGWLDWEFFQGVTVRKAEDAGIRPGLVGTALLMVVVAPVTLLIGVATAIFLEEYAKKGPIHTIISVNIANLAGVPSVIFGLLGLTVFVRFFNMGVSVLAGGLTLSLLVLPNVVVASQEAIKAVPNFLREASYGLGASKWTTIRKVVLPSSIPGIMTGSILAISRAIGETAPIVVLGVPALMFQAPSSIFDRFTALPIHIYNWTLDSVMTAEYRNLAAATIVVLLAVLFILNIIAIIIRNKFEKKY